MRAWVLMTVKRFTVLCLCINKRQTDEHLIYGKHQIQAGWQRNRAVDSRSCPLDGGSFPELISTWTKPDSYQKAQTSVHAPLISIIRFSGKKAAKVFRILFQTFRNSSICRVNMFSWIVKTCWRIRAFENNVPWILTGKYTWFHSSSGQESAVGFINTWFLDET